MSKQVYFETVRGGLVPVKILESRRYDSYIEVTKDIVKAYPKGYKFYTSNLYIVYKIGRNQVRPLSASERELF